jgi:hypothetical protein
VKQRTVLIVGALVLAYLAWHYYQAHQGQGVGAMAGGGGKGGKGSKQPASQMTG